MNALQRMGFLAAAGIALAASSGCSRGIADASTPLTIDVRMHFSKFLPGSLTVPAGRPIRFVVHNDDFLDHEFIVGDADMQARHEAGTEPHHGARPTEIDVPAGETVSTVVTFERRAGLSYACHAPGHFAYGMFGALTVR
ncbi:MAG: plastocyanin/azurin family copper-binding protein [Actinomycetota bacterium]